MIDSFDCQQARGGPSCGARTEFFADVTATGVRAAHAFDAVTLAALARDDRELGVGLCGDPRGAAGFRAARARRDALRRRGDPGGSCYLLATRPALAEPRAEFVRLALGGLIYVALYTLFLNVGELTVSSGAASFIVQCQPGHDGDPRRRFLLGERFGAGRLDGHRGLARRGRD